MRNELHTFLANARKIAAFAEAHPVPAIACTVHCPDVAGEPPQIVFQGKDARHVTAAFGLFNPRLSRRGPTDALRMVDGVQLVIRDYPLAASAAEPKHHANDHSHA